MLTGIIIDNLSMKTNNPKVKIFYETSLGLKLCNLKFDLVHPYSDSLAHLFALLKYAVITMSLSQAGETL